MTYNIGCLILGSLSDWAGIVLVRVIALILIVIGLLSMSFIQEKEVMVWVSWPCLALGGIVGHMLNSKCLRALPDIRDG